VHYEALDVYEQHFLKILAIIQIPNPTYAIAIVTAFQAALQAAITHHGTMLNNLDPVPTLVNFSFRQLIVTIANIPPTIDASVFANLMGEFF
jgi:hypothetical protein